MISTFWKREHAKSTTGLHFAYCWTHKRASKFYNNKKKAIKNLPCGCKNNRS